MVSILDGDRAKLDPKLILFDVGGVLVQLAGPRIVQDLSTENLSFEEVEAEWPEKMSSFETGAVDSEVWAASFIEHFHLPLSSHELITLFRETALCKYDGVDSFLEELGCSYDLACLSNIDPIRWEKIDNQFSLTSHFSECFLSFEIGFQKPDIEAFSIVCERTGLLAEDILFIDDRAENCDIGESLGFRSVQVLDFADAQSKVKRLLET